MRSRVRMAPEDPRAAENDMSRASSDHIRRLEDTIRAARAALRAVSSHEPVREPGNPNCVCGICRAERLLRTVKLRTLDQQ
jgi:hypothetical protein